MGDIVREGIQNVTYKNIINSAVLVKMILAVSKNRENLTKLSAEAKVIGPVFTFKKISSASFLNFLGNL